MVPLNRTYTVLDWMAALNLPALLITGSYLGTISHTLTALLALQSRNIPLAGLIINENIPSHSPAFHHAIDTYQGLKGYLPSDLPIVTVSHNETPDFQPILSAYFNQ